MVIVITGPTASGKTALSISLAKKLNGEIINADSTQVYKGLDIATAKVTKEEQDGIIHHLMDIKDIRDEYTVYEYQKDCRAKIAKIIGKGKTPIIVGGTGLYIKSALYNYSFEEYTTKQDYSKYTLDELYKRLLEVDPKTEIHKNNRKRIERALDYYYETNKPFSEKEKNTKLLYDTYFIGLTMDRQKLYERINKRVDIMLETGLIDEAKKIYETGIRTKAIMTPIGYKELFPYFNKEKSLEECIDLIKQNSRRYAKRQYTWFKNQMNINWFLVDTNNFNNTIDDINNALEKNF